MLGKNLYDRLNLQINCTTEEIKQSFRSLAKRYHPDTNGGKECSSEKYHDIRAAYEILIDPELRKNYNKSLRDGLAKEKNERIQEVLFTIDSATKLEIILAWSTTRPTFNTSFASSCLNRMAEGRELTEKQLNAIDNIILSFSIDIETWMDDELRASAISKFISKESENNYEESERNSRFSMNESLYKDF